MQAFDRSHVLVVGGAGFVGSNLVRELISTSSAQVLIVDNLLSAERCNVPDSKQVDFIEGSITQDKVLHQLPKTLDYVFHLGGKGVSAGSLIPHPECGASGGTESL